MLQNFKINLRALTCKAGITQSVDIIQLVDTRNQ